MSKLKNRLEKMASVDSQSYKKFVADLANLSDDFEQVLKDAFANEETYNVIMNDDEKTEIVAKLKELNQSISIQLLGL